MRNETTENDSCGTQMERRTFLKGSTGALVLAGLGPVALFGGYSAGADSGEFSLEYFSGMSGEWFHIDTGSWNSIELVQVEADASSIRVDQFTLRFRSSSNLAFDEGIYDMSQPDGSPIQLYLQPSEAGANGNYYQASFSLIKPLLPSC